ncbi:MAG TPA: helix-turn-helix domain-containing protein [Candidatus Sulfotelmatobacter sp.]|nr:helix-turn-helix domain-containing protein [Candidatus Sulfotelmatobacter sp.]
MPRKPDAQLEGRILDAAYKLWSAGGEQGLKMREVASAARTTAPTVYQRFRNKRVLLEVLRRRAQGKLFASVEPAKSLSDLCERYFEFALGHKHEYKLIHADWGVRLARDEPRPSFELLKRRLAERLGGLPEQHVRLALALAALAHGTAEILLPEGVHWRINRELRDVCVDAWESLVQHAREAGLSAKKPGLQTARRNRSPVESIQPSL